MPRSRSFQFSALNIVTHPHSPETYLELLRAIYRLRQRVRVRGNQHLMIGSLASVARDKPLEGLTGILFRFDQIDSDVALGNLDRGEEASEEERLQIRIPEGLVPNFQQFNFVFYPKTHQLHFESKNTGGSLAESLLKKFFDSACAVEEIIQEFGMVEVTVVPEHEQIERILSLPSLSQLVIDLRRPNPDDLSSEEDRVLGRMQKMRTQRLVETLTSEKGQTLAPDDQVTMLARIAAKNGSVLGKGRGSAGEPIQECTIDRSFRRTVHYNEAVDLPLDVLVTETQRP